MGTHDTQLPSHHRPTVPNRRNADNGSGVSHPTARRINPLRRLGPHNSSFLPRKSINSRGLAFASFSAAGTVSRPHFALATVLHCIAIQTESDHHGSSRMTWPSEQPANAYPVPPARLITPLAERTGIFDRTGTFQAPPLLMTGVEEFLLTTHTCDLLPCTSARSTLPISVSVPSPAKLFSLCHRPCPCPRRPLSNEKSSTRKFSRNCSISENLPARTCSCHVRPSIPWSPERSFSN